MEKSSRTMKKKKALKELISFISPFVLFIAIFLLAMLLTHVSATDQTDPVVQYWTDENYPPFEFKMPSGEAAGFSVDLISAVGEEEGFAVNATPHPWAHVKAALTNRTIDLSGTMAYDINRTDRFAFSVPVATLNWYLYVPDNSTIITLDQLQGRRIILAKGDIWEEKLNALKFPADITVVPDYRQQLIGLSNGGYDAAIINKPVALYLMDQLGIQNIKPVGEPVERMKLCFASHISNPDLVQKINEGIIILNRNGKYDEISRKWFEPEERKAESEIFNKVFLYILLPIIVLFFLILFWVLTLRRAVAKKTEEFKDEFSQRIKTLETLQESERTHKTLIDNLEGVVYRCLNNTDWTMEYMSDGISSLAGYTPQEITSRKIASYGSIIHPDDRNMVWNSVQAGITHNMPFRMTYRIICKDGTLKWVWEQGRGVYLNGELVALEGYIADITKEVHDHESLNKMSYSIEHLKEGVFWFDEYGLILETNIAFEHLTNDTNSHGSGTSVRSLPFTLQTTNWKNQ